jgi:hypothetical protein
LNRAQVAKDVAKCHPIVGEPSGSPPVSPAKERSTKSESERADGGWSEWTAAKLRDRKSHLTPLAGRAEDSDESEPGEPEGEAAEAAARADVRNLDRELSIMRRVFRKWCRLAGVEGKLCDDLAEGEFEVSWTRAVAPRVEGRIKMVTGTA